MLKVSMAQEMPNSGRGQCCGPRSISGQLQHQPIEDFRQSFGNLHGPCCGCWRQPQHLPDGAACKTERHHMSINLTKTSQTKKGLSQRLSDADLVQQAKRKSFHEVGGQRGHDEKMRRRT